VFSERPFVTRFEIPKTLPGGAVLVSKSQYSLLLKLEMNVGLLLLMLTLAQQHSMRKDLSEKGASGLRTLKIAWK
jgi:hypothetical protein